jgi:hypothetical protein
MTAHKQIVANPFQKREVHRKARRPRCSTAVFPRYLEPSCPLSPQKHVFCETKPIFSVPDCLFSASIRQKCTALLSPKLIVKI